MNVERKLDEVQTLLEAEFGDFANRMKASLCGPLFRGWEIIRPRSISVMRDSSYR